MRLILRLQINNLNHLITDVLCFEGEKKLVRKVVMTYKNMNTAVRKLLILFSIDNSIKNLS